MSTQAPPFPAGVSARRYSSLSRIFRVFYAPSSAFEDIAREPHFYLCWGVEIATMLLFAILAVHWIGAGTVAHQLLSHNPVLRNMPAAQQQKIEATTARTMAVRMAAGSAVGSIVTVLLVAAIFLFLVRFVWGRDGVRFKGLLAATIHGYLPLALKAMIALLVIGLAPDRSLLRLTNLVGSNPAFYLTLGGSPALRILLRSIDLFTLWTVGLLGLGLAKLTPRLKVRSAVTTVALLYALVVAATVGIATLV